MTIQSKVISSLQNPEVVLIGKLQDHKYRKQYGLFVAEGLRVCSTLLAHADLLEFICVTDSALLKNFPVRISNQHIRIVTESVMQKISQATSASGIVGVFKIPEQVPVQKMAAGLVLAQVADPGNMGTLIRTAAAMGVKTIVCIEGADPYGFKVVQSSAGNIAAVDIFFMTWQQVYENAHNQKLQLIALVSEKGIAPEKLSFENALLVVGSEAFGIPQKWIEECDKKMTIPMPGKTESLNAAVAGSIAMYLAWASKK